jgi:cell division protein ZapA (FtsZ GTPase activity inhibitor)
MSTDVSDKVKKYKVSIFGESYTLTSDESEEHITEVVQFLDSHMRDIASKTQLSNAKQIAVLAALQCISKTVQTKNSLRYHQEYTDKLLDLVSRETV